jgi:hypothetical protein
MWFSRDRVVPERLVDCGISCNRSGQMIYVLSNRVILARSFLDSEVMSRLGNGEMRPVNSHFERSVENSHYTYLGSIPLLP